MDYSHVLHSKIPTHKHTYAGMQTYTHAYTIIYALTNTYIYALTYTYIHIVKHTHIYTQQNGSLAETTILFQNKFVH